MLGAFKHKRQSRILVNIAQGGYVPLIFQMLFGPYALYLNQAVTVFESSSKQYFIKPFSSATSCIMSLLCLVSEIN